MVKNRNLPIFLAFTLSWVLLSTARNMDAPRGKATFQFADGKQIGVDYGRPSAQGQKVFGVLVPYGKIWSAGAGAATLLRTQASLQIGEVTVPPGKYSVYLLPSAEDWILILNQRTGQAANFYPTGYDFARIKLKKRTLSRSIDPFTIHFDSHGPGAGAMKFSWGDIEVWVNFEEQLNASTDEGDAS